jgi:NhaP-type Na+/H+ and K+/H+ antiporter
MDARNLTSNVIKEAISNGNYEITGALETGELVISIIGDFEREMLSKIFNTNIKENEKLENLKAFMSTRGRPAEELMQIYHQNYCSIDEKYKKGLRKR